MCGINGLICKPTNSDQIDLKISIMNNRIIHRGPDDDGFYSFDDEVFGVGMAMRRLSIIDLQTGKQPIFSEDKQKIIVFNGEIYNYKELRTLLVNKGISFLTQSDTEVILKLYEDRGVEAFAMLDGMFAFSIFDKTLNKVFIARDFFGEKPLYYMQEKDGFYWASELKSITSIRETPLAISLSGLNLFFQLTYIPAPFTIYKEVFKLEANHFITFDCITFTYKVQEIKQQFLKEEISTKREAVKKTHDLVFDSVNSRSISDVALGTFLSGGVDSSIVSLCLAQQSPNKIETFSIGFEKKLFDETDKSRAVAKLIGSNHHEFVIGEKDLSQNLDEILINFDEPFADSSALASYVVAEKTKQYVKVALTGDGGDEVFGGYNKYYMGKLNTRFTQIVPKYLHQNLLKHASKFLKVNNDNRGKRFKANRFLKAVNYDGDFYTNIISLGYQENEIEDVLLSEVRDENAIKYYKDKIGLNNKTLSDFRNIDRILSLEGDMLVKVDRTSMLASLECRAPFLNKKIWNFTNQQPESYLLNGWDKKHLLKEAFKGYFPKNFLDKTKKGFGVPVGDWLRGELKNELISYIDRFFLIEQNLFQYEKITLLVNNHLSGKVDNTFKVWTFFCFQKWYKNKYA